MRTLFTHFQTRFDQKILMQQGMLSYNEGIVSLETGDHANAAETLATAAGYMGQSQEGGTSLLTRHPYVNSTVTAYVTGDLDSYLYLEEVLVLMVSDREQYYDALQDISEVLAAGGVEDPAMKQKFTDAAEALASLKDPAFVGNEASFWAESMGIGGEGM